MNRAVSVVAVAVATWSVASCGDSATVQHDGATVDARDGATSSFDSGTPPLDSGAASFDSGTPPIDSGTPPRDSGTPPRDSGTVPFDSGTPPRDSGTPPTDSGTPPRDSGTPPTDSGTPPPTTTCAPRALLADTSRPTTVVGTGTAASCTEAALRSAATTGGTIVFDCGASPVTITVASTVVFTRETVLDGGGRVTLSGGTRARILKLDSGYDVATPRLTVQRLGFRDGRSPAGGGDTAVGGGAIYRDGGSLTVVDCTFTNNQAPLAGQDVAGGAIYGFGGGETVIENSTFTGNSASNGGAVGSLNGNLTITNSTFSGNSATGTGGNPGNGGCGGALYMDGGRETTTLCGVRLASNTAGAIGGAVFRVSNDNSGTFSMDRSTVDANRVTPTTSGNAGGLYLQGLALTVSASTISRNRAYYNGGLWIGGGRAQITNATFADNTAVGSNGGALWLANSPTGTLLNCTIANNRSTGTNTITGAIFGAGLALKNTIVAYNTAMYTPGCNTTHPDNGGNLQWPGGSLCTSSITVADPQLGPLGNNGGPTETLVPSATGPAARRGSGCPTTDQRGRPRATMCTSGAVELP